LQRAESGDEALTEEREGRDVPGVQCPHFSLSVRATFRGKKKPFS